MSLAKYSDRKLKRNTHFTTSPILIYTFVCFLYRLVIFPSKNRLLILWPVILTLGRCLPTNYSQSMMVFWKHWEKRTVVIRNFASRRLVNFNLWMDAISDCWSEERIDITYPWIGNDDLWIGGDDDVLPGLSSRILNKHKNLGYCRPRENC